MTLIVQEFDRKKKKCLCLRALCSLNARAILALPSVRALSLFI
ncbi:unnamed protein product [Arabidopsis halleri]